MFINYSLTLLHFIFLLHFLGSIDPSEIFLEHFADICDAIEVKPLPIVNQLLVAKLISLNLKKDVESMSGDAYDKANKVVNDLQRQVDEKGMAFLKAICCFFLKQKHDLKDIGTRMKSRLKVRHIITYYTITNYITKSLIML